jgi:protein TonB
MRDNHFLCTLVATVLSSAGVAHQPVPLFTPDDYPRDALAHSWQGEVTVDLTISRKGRVTNCAVTKSSGYEVLDTATCKIFRKRAKFAPQLDSTGKAIAFHIVPVPIIWTLP